jgi:hypothetical protein
MALRHFKRGSGCFACAVCGRKTRVTTQDSYTLCAECWELAGIENSILYGCGTPEEYAEEVAELIAAAVKKGSNEAELRSAFEVCFEGPKPYPWAALRAALNRG